MRQATGRCRQHDGRKTPKKTPNGKRCVSGRNSNELIPGNPGNSGGKPGRSGRKPNEFKVFCNELLCDPDVQAKMLSAAQGGDLKPVEVAAKYTQKLPRQMIEHEGGERPIQIDLGNLDDKELGTLEQLLRRAAISN